MSGIGPGFFQQGPSQSGIDAAVALARRWAILLDETVDGVDYSSKQHALWAQQSAASAAESAALSLSYYNSIVSYPLVADAEDVTYTPSTLADWNTSTDPGNVDDALDQLAGRVKDIEELPGAPSAGDVTYTPAELDDWDGGLDPGSIADAVDQLAARIENVEASPGVSDAADVTYTPATAGDWDGGVDPGNVDDALDQLAARVNDIEASPGVSDAGDVTYTPTTVADWDGGVDPGSAEDALDQLAARTSDAESALVSLDGRTDTLEAALIPVQCFPIAASDETTVITAGTGKVTFRMPYAFTLSDIRASLTTAQAAGSIFTVDVNENGASILSTKLTIDNTEKTSTTAATARVISDTNLADDAEITIDVVQVGTPAATGLKVYLIGKPQTITESLVIPVTDETTAITAGAGKLTFRMPHAFVLTGIRASLSTAQASGSIFTVDVNEGGTSILSTKITIDNTEKTSTTAAAAPVISDTALAEDAEITIDVDQVGNGTAIGLKVTFIGYRP